jgi:hypothetical protein
MESLRIDVYLFLPIPQYCQVAKEEEEEAVLTYLKNTWKHVGPISA